MVKYKYNYPCFCLKRGFFLLITYSRPFLLTILQSVLRFLMEALTFIFVNLIFYLMGRNW
jgi:hypothetical protein